MKKLKGGPVESDARKPWLMKHAALAYANQWFVADREFMGGLKATSSDAIDAVMLGKLAATYMVARGFKKENERRWNDAAACVRRSAISARPITKEVHALAKKLGQVAPREGKTETMLLSAATKFLWFAGKHDVRILDKRAVDALIRLGSDRKLKADYARFSAAWQEHFQQHKQEIKDAVAHLPDRLEWTRIPSKFHDEAKTVFRKPWFTDRVFDKYLWTIGAATSLD